METKQYSDFSKVALIQEIFKISKELSSRDIKISSLNQELTDIHIQCEQKDLELGDNSAQKNVENAHQVDKKNKKMLETIPAAIFLTSSQLKKIDYLSSFFTNLLGYTLEDIPSLEKWFELAYHDKEYRKNIIDETMLHFKKSIDDPTYRTIMYSFVKCKDGSQKHIQWQFVIMGDQWLGCGFDITSIKEYEKEILESKEQSKGVELRLSLAIASAKLGIWDWNIIDNTMIWNDRMFELYGIDNNAFVNNVDAWTKGLHPEDKQRTLDDLNAAINGEKDFDLSFRVIHLDGRIVHISSNAYIVRNEEGKAMRMLGNNKDITQIKLTEEGLIDKELKYRTLFETADDAIMLFTDGIWVDCNQGALRTFGCTRDQMIGVHPIRFSPPKQPDGSSSEIEAVKRLKLAFEGEPQSFEWVHFKWDKSLFDAEVKLNRIDIGGKIYIQSIVRDISKRKHSETALIKSKVKAEKNEQLKTAFLMNLSHEIRTPMNGILGFSSLLMMPNLSENNKDEYITIINKSGERLMDTINDIVEISKIEIGDISVNISEINLSETMQYYYDLFKLQAKDKGLDFILTKLIPDNITFIKTDKHKIDGIMLNLIKNAIKFTNKGKIEIGCKFKNSELILYVTDTGKGIDEGKFDMIFDRFSQGETELTRGYEGSGIGLSIVKAYVEALNGKINLVSDLSKGSTFTIILPSKPLKKHINQFSEQIIIEPQAHNRKILVTEDDDISFYFIETILSECNIIRAKNGAQAIDMLSENPDISLILMDIKMQGNNDGLETTKKIRQNNHEIPIIAQTAFGLDIDKKRALDAGCTDYISKPYRTKELKSIVNLYCTTSNKISTSTPHPTH